MEYLFIFSYFTSILSTGPLFMSENDLFVPQELNIRICKYLCFEMFNKFIMITLACACAP